MDLFEKLKPNELAAEAMEKGIYPYFHALETRQDIQPAKRRLISTAPAAPDPGSSTAR